MIYIIVYDDLDHRSCYAKRMGAFAGRVVNGKSSKFKGSKLKLRLVDVCVTMCFVGFMGWKIAERSKLKAGVIVYTGFSKVK